MGKMGETGKEVCNLFLLYDYQAQVTDLRRKRGYLKSQFRHS